MRKTTAAVVLAATLGSGIAFAKTKDVHVSDYTRKNGTTVHAYDRSSPTDRIVDDALSNPIPLIIGLLGLGIIIGIVSAVSKKITTKQSTEQVGILANEAQNYFAKIGQTGKLPFSPSTSVVLASDEKACLDETSSLYEEKSSRIYGGTGTRIKGIWVGGGGSTSVQSLRRIDSGRLTLTNKKIVFNGSMESRVIEIKDIVSIVPFVDSIQITSKKRAKTQRYTVRNPFIWWQFIEMIIKGQVSVHAVAEKSEPEETIPQESVADYNKKPQDPLPEEPDIKFNCPNCGQPIEAESELAGKPSSCPTCKKSLVVPVG